MQPSDKKKVFIITYSRAINYGSALQSYALNRFLRNEGFDAQTIDYTNTAQQQLYRIFERLRDLKSILRNIQSFLNFRKLQEHRRRFDDFIKDKVPQTMRIDGASDFDLIKSCADFYICGSDQIWNADCDDFDSNYMLSFVEDKSKCISYAPSLGAGGSSRQTLEAIRTFTPQFKALSAREQSGADIISGLTGRNVATVVDPVLLLSKDEWKEVAKERQIKKDYILGYFIGDRPGMREFAQKMSKATELPVVVIYKNLRDLKYGFKNLYDSGPDDFVSLVLHSKGIVTNSFHAVAFSLIFNKNFWVFNGRNSKDSRISGLLNILGLSDRIIDDRADDISDYLSDISYSDLNHSILDRHIADSKKFLLKNLC